MTTTEKSDHISKQILQAREYGINLQLDRKTLVGLEYQLVLKEYQFPDDVYIYCNFKEGYSIKVPAFEIETEDFDSIISTLREMYQDLI
tara:strand:- start:86 stop:352 length:267 start_codon:yes stop_codon:yes gene_type:complete